EPRWTSKIPTEVTRTLVGRFGKTPEKFLYRQTSMREFFPGALIEKYESLVPEMKNHPKDRHVLAGSSRAWRGPRGHLQHQGLRLDGGRCAIENGILTFVAYCRVTSIISLLLGVTS